MFFVKANTNRNGVPLKDEGYVELLVPLVIELKGKGQCSLCGAQTGGSITGNSTLQLAPRALLAAHTRILPAAIPISVRDVTDCLIAF